MNEEQMATLLEKLAEKLGTTAEHLWSILVKQAPIAGMVNLTLYVFTLLVLFIAPFVIKKIIKKDNDYEGLWVGYAFIVFLLILIDVAIAPMTLAAFFNPEYWALERVISLLNNK